MASVFVELPQVTVSTTGLATEATLAAISAQLPTTLGQKTSANSISAVIASDQSGVATKSPVNAAGSVVNGSLSGTSASSESAPANSVGFIVMNPSDGTDPIRFRIGGTASTTAGLLLEPGRDSGFVPCSATLSICSTVSGTNKYEILWILSA